MSLHSPTESMVGIRIPKLKVRNRAPEDPNGQAVVSHSAQPSTTTYYTNFSDPSTAPNSTVHSPQPSTSQTSPVSPISPVRIPKVAVRNRPTEDVSSPEAFRFPAPTAVNPESLDNDQTGVEDEIRPVSSPTDAPLSRPQLYDTVSYPSDLPALTERNLASRDSNGEYPWPQRSAKKKGKVSSVFGFFAVKEPSALALEQFAESQRRQVELKGGRGNTAGNTNRKLPSEVPKVNSKWDGLPDWAREAAKEAKKDEMGKSDTLLNKMADHRRPSSQHNSVSTFGSEGSGQGKANATPATVKQRNSKTGQRPTSSRTHSASSSVKRLRNPSRGRGVPSKSSNPFQKAAQSSSNQKQLPNPSPDMTGLPKITSYFPGETTSTSSPREDASRPSAPSQSAVHAFYTPTDTRPSNHPSHAHKRTMSDPRLNFGMDNVAAITAFLGDEDVSVPRILPRYSPIPSESTAATAIQFPEEPPPPIPRKSSRRKSSQSNLDLTKFRAGLRRVPTSETIDSFVTAEQPPSLSDFPSPPNSYNPTGAEEPSNKVHEDITAAPHREKQVRAIYPPDPPALSSALLSSDATPISSSASPSPQKLVKHKASLGRVSPFPSALSVVTRAAPSPSPTELSEQWYKSPKERLGLTSPSPVNRGDAAPWELADASVDAGMSGKTSPTSNPSAGDSTCGKKARWSSFGRKAPS